MVADATLIEEVTEKDSKGKCKLVPIKAVRWLQRDMHKDFLTTSTTDILYIYHEDTGMWKDDAEEYIKATLQEYFGEYLTTHTVTEVINHTKRKEYVDSECFNKKEKLVNLKNGVFDLEIYELIQHGPDYLFTYCLPYDYDPEIIPVNFIRFLFDVCGNDLKIVIGILEGFAYTFIPGYPIQKANMLVGTGANGKGTLLTILRRFAGEDNCEHLTIQTICKQTGYALARLQGRLLNIGPDLPSNGLGDVSNFKALTGGDRISAEVKYIQSSVRMTNSAKLWFSSNTIPNPSEDTIAFYRRWNVWKFTKQYPEGRDIAAELTTETELTGIFNLVVQVYAIISTTKKYTFASDVETTRKDYLKSANTVKLFADERLTYNRDSNISKASIFENYIEYCKRNNLISSTENAFWRELRKHIEYKENIPVRGGERFIQGQALVEEIEDPSTPLTTKEIAQKYEKLMLHQVHQDNQVFSLLFLILHTSYFETIRLKLDEPNEPVANIRPEADNSETILEINWICVKCGQSEPLDQLVRLPDDPDKLIHSRCYRNLPIINASIGE